MKQLRLVDLLKDPFYRKWLTKVPTVRGYHTQPPWRIFLQAEEGGRWQRADLPTYQAAYRAVAHRLKTHHDLAIHCKPHGFNPPVIRKGEKKLWYPGPTGHSWCVYCRRYTIFKYYTKHPAIPNMVTLTEPIRMCGICGARQLSMKQYNTILRWPLGG